MKRFAAALFVLALGASTAHAHPLPKAATPAPNAVLGASPTEIRIRFNESFVPAFTGLALQSSAGKAVALGPAKAANGDTELAAPITTRLAPGAYTVSWHAVGTDTHHVAGHYSFRVK